MSFNGSGSFLINTAGQPVVSGTVISSTAFNALTADLATGLSTCITKDGQTTVTANIPMANYKFTGLGVGSGAADSANLSQVQSTVVKLLASVSGTDTITAVGSPTVAAYAAGQMFYFVAAGDNTGAVTINIDSLGAKAVTRDGSVALAAGDIKSGEVVVVVYDGTRFQVVSQLNSSGDARFANVSIASALNVGGVATFSAGTAAAPAITTTGDTNTGIFFPAADTIAFAEGGVESARLDSSGNLGIGTSSPTSIGAGYTSVTTSGSTGGGVVFAQAGTQKGAIFNGANNVYVDVSNSAGNLYLRNTSTGATTTLDPSGNLGLGVTPSAWDTLLKAIIVEDTAVFSGQTNSEGMRLGSNWYYNSGFKYQTSAAASRYDQASGAHSWHTAASGTAGNAITFTQAMTLDASSNLIVGGSTPYLTSAGRGNISIEGSSSAILNFGIGGNLAFYIFHDNTNVNLQNQKNGAMLFSTNAAERARITAAGQVQINTTSGGFDGFLFVRSGVSATEAISCWNDATTGDNELINFFTDGGTGRGSITYNRGAGQVAYNVTSDIRLKDNITDAVDAGSKIDALQVRQFSWKETGNHVDYGFVAQELDAVVPHAVSKPEDEEAMWSVDYSKLVPMLVKEIQSLRARVAALEGA
jgi:hypothetical protein